MIDERRYADHHRRLVNWLDLWGIKGDRLREALRIIADGEKRAGNCAFAVNEAVFMATDCGEIAERKKLESLIYSALAKMQTEDRAANP